MEEKKLSKNQILWGRIISILLVLGTGIFLVLVSCGVIEKLSIGKIIYPAVFIMLGLIFLFNSLIQLNPISMWFSMIFSIPAIMTLLTKYTAITYSQLYPLYIAIPCFASFFSMLMIKHYRENIKVIVFFGVIALFCALFSSGILSTKYLPAVLLAIFTVLIVLIMTLALIKNNKSHKEK